MEGGGDLQIFCHYMNVDSMAETLKPYYMLKKILLERIGHTDRKTLGTSSLVNGIAEIPGDIAFAQCGRTFTDAALTICCL